jgi:predicted nucleotidyltransferase component of viral defense system
MNELLRHERFELAVLERMKNRRLLDPLVFGGGTMLRLCYDLNRYSTDLDFWIVKHLDVPAFAARARDALAAAHEVTDAETKRNTLLIELRSPASPRRLKIEIRKDGLPCDAQERIAFSKADSRQVLLRVHTLEESMRRKIGAALDRGLVRDFFDLEFLLKRGVTPELDAGSAARLLERASGFKTRDFRVTLGSVLEPADRAYYAANGFAYLCSRLEAMGG